MNFLQGISKHYFWGGLMLSRIGAVPGDHLNRNNCFSFVEIGPNRWLQLQRKKMTVFFCIVFTKTKRYPWGKKWGFLEHLTVTVVNGPCHVLNREKLEIILCKTNELLFSDIFFTAFQPPHPALCHSSGCCSLHWSLGQSGICLLPDHNAFQHY